MQRYFKLRSSRTFALLLVFLCAASLATLRLLSLPPLWLLVLAVVVLCWSVYCLLLGATLRLGLSCVAFRLEDGEKIVLLLRSGRHLQCRVSPYCLVTPYLVILNVTLCERRGGRSVMIMPDSMSADSFRRLRVALRWNVAADQTPT